MRGIGILTLMDPPTCGIGFESREGYVGCMEVEICLIYPLLDKHGRQNEIPDVS